MFQFIYTPVISDLYAVRPMSFDPISKITYDKMGLRHTVYQDYTSLESFKYTVIALPASRRGLCPSWALS